jgi:hypothetical protein
LYAPETTVTEEGAAGAKAALGVQAECPSVPIAESDLGESVQRDGNTVTLDEFRCSSARRVRKPRLVFQQT